MPYEPSNLEEEYVKKQEIEQMKLLAEKRKKEIEAGEKEKLQKLHYMRCPKCGDLMQEIEYKEIKLDKCFSCGGIYFDDGELDLLISKETKKDSFVKSFFSVFGTKKE